MGTAEARRDWGFGAEVSMVALRRRILRSAEKSGVARQQVNASKKYLAARIELNLRLATDIKHLPNDKAQNLVVRTKLEHF